LSDFDKDKKKRCLKLQIVQTAPSQYTLLKRLLLLEANTTNHACDARPAPRKWRIQAMLHIKASCFVAVATRLQLELLDLGWVDHKSKLI